MIEGDHCLEVQCLRAQQGAQQVRLLQHSQLSVLDAAARLIQAAVAMLAAKYLSLDCDLGKGWGRQA